MSAELVLPDEPLARFLTQKGQFARQTGRVMPNVFLPPEPTSPEQKRTLSVSRIKGLAEAEVWPLGDPIAAAHDGKLYGRAEIAAEAFYEVGLGVDPDDEPPRHANIVGWPDDRSERLLLAAKLAPKAKLVLRVDG